MLRRWIQFYWERCGAHAVGLASSAFASDLIVQRLLGNTQVVLHAEILISMITIPLMGLAFRCSDELRDMDTDLQYFPDRPLAAGRISPREVKALALLAVAVSLVINIIWPYAPIPLFLGTGFLALIHSWYFMPRLISGNRFLAVTANLPFLFLLYLYVGEAAAFRSGYVQPGWIPAAVAVWMIIPLHTYEFARKVVAAGQEREGYQTYSAMIGPRPAAWLAFSTAIVHYLLALLWPPARLLYGSWIILLGAVLLFYFGVTVFFSLGQGHCFKNKKVQLFFNEGLGGTAGIYGVCSRVFSVLSAFMWF